MKWIAPHGAATSTERYINAQPTIAGSNPDAAFFNTVLDELLAVIVAADMTPTDENLHQIADAIEYLTERAATSGVTKGAFWFGKTTANFTVPNPTLPEQNYIDFTTLNTYSAKSDLSGWTQTGTFVPPVGIDFTILITSKFWDIPEQDGQQGGWAQYNHTDDEWSWWPKIISFKDAALTGVSTAPTPTTSSPSNQIANKEYVDKRGTGRNIGDTFLTMRNDNELNGAVECDGTTYNTTDFTGAQSIGQLLADGKVPYVSMATYATEISTKGWCDKFGWDGTGNTQFKVPTLNAYIWQKLQLGIKGSIGSGSGGTYFVATQSSFTQGTRPDVGGYGVSVTNDQTIPGASVDITSEDVSQQRCMVQLAVSTTDQALETCTSVLADVANLKDHRVIAFQAPTAQNNYTWYRKYADGWVEQGGAFATVNGDYHNETVTLLIEMNSVGYSINVSSATNGNAYAPGISTKSSTGFTVVRLVNIAAYSATWQVSGMARG